MLIEVDSLKELEPGKVYAIQTNKKSLVAVTRGMSRFTELYGIYFIVFDEETHPIDAPKPTESEKENASSEP